MSGRCGDCRYSEKYGDYSNVLTCRINPPVYRSDHELDCYPKVRPESWCAAFSKQTEADQ